MDDSRPIMRRAYVEDAKTYFSINNLIDQSYYVRLDDRPDLANQLASLGTGALRLDPAP